MTESLQDRLDAVLQAGGDQDVLDRVYDAWAHDYEKDIWASGNPQKAFIVAFVERYISRSDARILDGGCGTGILASLLYPIGYRNVVGIDASDGMLEVARAKGCYHELHKMLLAARINFPDESFDGAIVAGVLTEGHAPPESLDGILSLLKPEAPIIFTMVDSAYEENGFRSKVEALTEAGAWVLIEKTVPFRAFPFLEHHTDRHQWIAVYRKT